jgi:hypothetical protein
MPFRSKAQQKWMFAAESRGEVKPGTARKWAHATQEQGGKDAIEHLPEHVKKASINSSAINEAVAGQVMALAFRDELEKIAGLHLEKLAVVGQAVARVTGKVAEKALLTDAVQRGVVNLKNIGNQALTSLKGDVGATGKAKAVIEKAKATPGRVSGAAKEKSEVVLPKPAAKPAPAPASEAKPAAVERKRNVTPTVAPVAAPVAAAPPTTAVPVETPPKKAPRKAAPVQPAAAVPAAAPVTPVAAQPAVSYQPATPAAVKPSTPGAAAPAVAAPVSAVGSPTPGAGVAAPPIQTQTPAPATPPGFDIQKWWASLSPNTKALVGAGGGLAAGAVGTKVLQQ